MDQEQTKQIMARRTDNTFNRDVNSLDHATLKRKLSCSQQIEEFQKQNRRYQVLLELAQILLEEQTSLEQVVYRIMVNTQSLIGCERCQVLLIDDDTKDIDQFSNLPTNRYTKNYFANNANDIILARQEQSNQPARHKWNPNCISPIKNIDYPEPESLNDSEENIIDCYDSEDSFELDSKPLFSLIFDLGSDDDAYVLHHNERPKLISKNGLNKLGESVKYLNRDPFPINIGITSYVATTGETVNIENAHEDPRFDSTIDKEYPNDDSENRPCFKHKSILCVPIRNGKHKIIGVSQLINKRKGTRFSKDDENLFAAFSTFCGLAIQNTLMYEKLVKFMAKQRVTLEVLSYHATAPVDEARRLSMVQVPSSYALNLSSLRFNDFSLDDQNILKSCLRFFYDLDLVHRFQIDRVVLCNWILTVQKNYRNVTNNPIVGGSTLKATPIRYHNWRHAFNVCQMMFAILTNTQVCRVLGELETLALLIACLCHDLDHRGTNNSFQTKSASPLAQLYSTSTMEHHHFDQCVMIINSPGNQILANLTPDEYSKVISLIKESILATDLANHFRRRDRFFELINKKQFDWPRNKEHRSILRCMLMTACDLGAVTKPWPVQKAVADLVMGEFYQQGDIERQELKIEPIDMMDRDKMSKLPEMQISFIDSICTPIYKAFASLFPDDLQALLDGCKSNRSLWDHLAKDQNCSYDINKNQTIDGYQDDMKDFFHKKNDLATNGDGRINKQDCHDQIYSDNKVIKRSYEPKLTL